MGIHSIVADSISDWEIGGLDMTIKELVKAVTEGDIKSVEVYDDYFQSWSEDKRSIFLAELTAVMVSELAANTRWEDFRYDRCRFCSDYLKKKWDEETTNQNYDHKPLTKEREINIEVVSSWFNATFKGAGNGNINHLSYLIEDLKQKRSNKDFAKIAYLIHNSKHSIKTIKQNPFTKFYESFCIAIGCERKKYEPCKLKDEDFARKFYYLQ